jgi:AraC-like DNA-binding protein
MAAHHGILNPRAGEAKFRLTRFAPSAALAPLVEGFWLVRWDLAAPFTQETLPFPCVQLVIGDHQPGIHGPPLARFVAHLSGADAVLGVKFQPGGFYPFLRRDLVGVVGRTLPFAAVFGEPFAAALDAQRPDPRDDADDAARVARLDALLVARAPALDPLAARATAAVVRAQADPALARASDLAAALGTSPRGLERLFRRYVGVPPKWVIRRFRIHEACERVKTGAAPAWAALAHDLGYFDQAHFIRDFKAQVGRTPADYAAACATPPAS